MQRIAILILLILAGCVSELPQEYSRPALEATVEVSPDKDIEADRVIFIVSDYEKAARTSLAVGESVYLPTEPPVNITVLEKTRETVTFEINKKIYKIRNGVSTLLENGQIRIKLSE